MQAIAESDSLALLPSASHESTIIFLHGFGETGAQWERLGTLFHSDDRFRNTKIIIPTACLRNVTLYEESGRMLHAWYDIPSWNDIASEKNDEGGMQAARVYVESLIQAEVEAGIPASAIFIGGFSQGGCLALYMSLTCEVAIGGYFALSSYLPMAEKLQETALKSGRKDYSSVFIGHGSADPQVKWNWAERSWKALDKVGFRVDFHTYRVMFHYICTEEFEDLKTWLCEVKAGVFPARNMVHAVSSPSGLFGRSPANILE